MNKQNHESIKKINNDKKTEPCKINNINNYEFLSDTQKIDNYTYPVYRNDIKFKKYRNIDSSRATWTDDVKQDYKDKDTDSIEYRLEECKREKNETLDLSHMQKECFEQLFTNKYFLSIKTIIQHIFAKDSDLYILPNLSSLINLQTLDVSCNKLNVLPELPKSLEELIVNENRLTFIDSELPKLLRFNGADNILTQIKYNESLERIHINNNPIDNIPQLSNLYFLDASHTKIKNIYPMRKLKYLDVSYTDITIIPEMPCLEYLQCNETRVSDISVLKSLNSLVIVNSKINRIHYMPKLYTLTYHNSTQIILSSRYKIMHTKKNKSCINEITFNTSHVKN